MAGLAALVAVAAWSQGAAVPVIATGAVVAAVGAVRDPWPVRVLVVVLLIGGVGAVRADAAWSGLHPRTVGPYEGWVVVVGDPQPYPGATRVVIEVDGQRYEHWARGRAKRTRVDEWQAGDRLLVSAQREALDVDRQQRVAWQHIVGEVQIDFVADTAEGGALARASNRVRDAIERGSTALPPDDAALFRGLVIGDDRDQPAEMVDRFRASGLSHLTAVSGDYVTL